MAAADVTGLSRCLSMTRKTKTGWHGLETGYAAGLIRGSRPRPAGPTCTPSSTPPASRPGTHPTPPQLAGKPSRAHGEQTGTRTCSPRSPVNSTRTSTRTAQEPLHPASSQLRPIQARRTRPRPRSSPPIEGRAATIRGHATAVSRRQPWPDLRRRQNVRFYASRNTRRRAADSLSTNWTAPPATSRRDQRVRPPPTVTL